ncbi:MAG: lamin tail domain-containing protein, partial [Candidatus Omnitrophica bacterium]|nr:lamin tail domain-containing protein [Candidatus Omnitrophota bacterium]
MRIMKLATLTLSVCVLSLIALSIFLQPAHASYSSCIIINEVVISGQQQQLTDEDGEKQDWIELYNASAYNINLSGMYLTDDDNDFYKWALPNINLGPRQYLLIYCSGKNRSNPAGNLHANFNLSAGNSVSLYDEDDGLLDQITADQTTYIPADCSLSRAIDGSQSFTYDSRATPGSTNTDPPIILINEVMSNNGNTVEFPSGSGKRPDWIELYNLGSTSADIKNYKIQRSNDGGATYNSWEFLQSTIIPAKGYLIVYANSADIQSPPQTDWNISSSGAALRLKDRLGNVIDQVTCPSLESNTSYGRTTDGGSNFTIMVTATPGAVNQPNSAPNPAAAALRINEVISSNKSSIADYQG